MKELYDISLTIFLLCCLYPFYTYNTERRIPEWIFWLWLVISVTATTGLIITDTVLRYQS